LFSDEIIGLKQEFRLKSIDGFPISDNFFLIVFLIAQKWSAKIFEFCILAIKDIQYIQETSLDLALSNIENQNIKLGFKKLKQPLSFTYYLNGFLIKSGWHVKTYEFEAFDVATKLIFL